MNWLAWTYYQYARHFSRASIRNDAAKGVYTCEERIREWLGNMLPFKPLENSEHQRLADEANCDGELAERKAAVEAQEQAWALKDRPFALIVSFLVLFVFECLSMVGLFATIGIDMPERLIYGVAAAAGVFALITVVVAFARRPPNPQEV